jgi:hypothetical protein
VVFAGADGPVSVLVTALLCAGCGRFGYDGVGANGDGGPVDAPVDADADGDAAADAATLPGEVVVAGGPDSSRRPTLAWNGSRFLVVYDDDQGGSTRELFLQPIAPDGTLVGAAVQLTDSAESSSTAAAVWNGSELAVAWEQSASSKSELMFGRFSAAGAPLGQIQLGQTIQLALNPAIVWTGSEHGVAWDDGKQNVGDVLFARIDAAGALVGTVLQRTANSGISIRTALAWTGSAYGMAWEDNESGVYEVEFGRASSAGASLGGVVNITSDGTDAFDVSLAWNGVGYGLLWGAGPLGSHVVVFQLLDEAGTPQGAPVPLSSGAGDARRTRMVWAGDRFALVYVQDDRVWFAELNADGSVRRAPAQVGGASGPQETNVSLVWAGSTYGVAWSDERSGTPDVTFTVVAR